MAKKDRLEIRIDAWVTAEMHDRLQRVADRDERTVSFVVRKMIDNCLAVIDPQPAARPMANGHHSQQHQEQRRAV
jgi:hypothetical protein